MILRELKPDVNVAPFSAQHHALDAALVAIQDEIRVYEGEDEEETQVVFHGEGRAGEGCSW